MRRISRFFDAIDRRLEDRFAVNRRGLGRLFALFSSLFLYLNPLFMKLSRETHLLVAILVRSNVLVFAALLFLRAHAAPTVPDRRTAWTLVLRGALSTLVTFLYYGALVVLPVQIVAVAFQTNTFFTYFLEVLFFGGRFTALRLLCLLGVVLGLAFILNPNLLGGRGGDSPDALYVVCVLCVLASALVKGVINVLLKSLAAADPLVNGLFFGATSLLISGAGFVGTRSVFTLGGLGAPFLVLSGVASFGYQTFNMMAIANEDASVVSVFEGLTVLYSFAVDVAFLGVRPRAGAVFGSALVLASLTALSLSKRGEGG